MNIGKFSVKRPVTITMLALIAILFGMLSFSRLAIDLMPEIELPVVVVVTTYDGAGPEEIEELVTKPIENAMASLSGIDTISSSSTAGYSTVMLLFDYGTNLDSATNDIRDSIEIAKFSMPEEAQDNISLIKMNLDSMPIISIGVSGDRSLDDVKKIVDDKVIPRLERISGVAAATSSGGRTQQVTITADPYKLSAYGLNMSSISGVIASENVNSPGGYITQGNREILVRALGQYETVEELRDTQVALPSGGVARLGDLVDIEIGLSDISSISTLNGEEVISIGIQKESDGNTVDVARRVAKVLNELDEELYDDIELKIAYSSADMINIMIRNLESNLFMAVFIAMIIVFLFLGNIRSTIIIGVSIPLSLITTFALVYFKGFTINLVTLAALALSVGMVVDNSTVVLENIYRHRSMGKSKYQAAIEGTQEVVTAVVASTLTTVAVYLPFVFVRGLTSQIFVPFALAICFALLASLVVSITVVPMMSSKLLVMYEHGEKKKNNILVKLADGFEALFTRFVSWYQGVLLAALSHKKTTALIVTVALAGSCCLIPFIGAELLPPEDMGQINITITMPSNTLLEETRKVSREVGELIDQIPEVTVSFETVGGSGGMSLGGKSSNTSSYTVVLTPLDQRKRTCKDIAYALQKECDKIPGATIEVAAVDMMSMMSSSSNISYSIKGQKQDDIEMVANEVEAILQSVEGTVEISNSLDDTAEELNIIIDRTKAAYYNISPSTAYSMVAMALNSMTVSKYRGGEEELDIVLTYPKEFTTSLSNLENIMIPSNTGGQVPLSEIATIQHGFGQKTISRTGQSRVATVSCNVYGRDLSSVSKDIQEKMNTIPIPQGVTISNGGDLESMEETFTDLAQVIVVALLLVYMVMACQFESLWLPLLIMASVPVMFIGVFVGLLVTGQTFNMMSLMGVLMLEGIVVNNAIVLIDYIQQLRGRGMCKREAVVETAKTRLRPILVTTLTTVFAMMPQVFTHSQGSATFKPMAVTVIFGLLFSTVISLIVIPVLYEAVEAWPRKIRRKLMKNNQQEEIDNVMLALEDGCWHDWEELQQRMEAHQAKEEEVQQAFLER